MPQLNANAPYARKLKGLLDNDDYGFKVEELAEVAGCSKRHLYNVLDPGKDTNLGADKKDKISRYLSEHGITDLAYTGLDDAYEDLDPDEALRHLDDIRHELADLEAEIARLKARQ